MEDYIEVNRSLWNKKTPHHVSSTFYNVSGFLKGEISLNQIELDLLGPLKGKKVLHLQCHFGLDTLSLERLGARAVGVDFSDAAIAEAQKLADKSGLNARFLCSDVYGLPALLEDAFDIVFTSYGTITWLPDLSKWAHVIAHYLKPEGAFVMAEFHPMVWMFDEEFKKINYDYFNRGAIVEKIEGSYADPDAPIHHEAVSWNHPLSEVVQALINEGLHISHLQEYDYSPFPAFKHAVEVGPQEYQIEHLENKLPLTYALKANRMN